MTIESAAVTGLFSYNLSFGLLKLLLDQGVIEARAASDLLVCLAEQHEGMAEEGLEEVNRELAETARKVAAGILDMYGPDASAGQADGTSATGRPADQPGVESSGQATAEKPNASSSDDELWAVLRPSA